jgi:ABC-type bacteriocin/lantibiotic exporter with double-glycine peptidase domain
LLIGGLLVINNEMNIGQFVASEIVIIIIINSLEKIIMGMETIFDVLTAVTKIGEVSDIILEDETGIDFGNVIGDSGIAISLHNLSYTAGERTTNILSNIDLDIEAGERLCILGTNASGKTTLLRIIMGWYENFSGSISYNNIPHKNINISSFRSFVGDHVSEEHLFYGSLEKNISMGRAEVSVQDIMNICDEVGLTDYIQTLPKGLDTVIASDGEDLPQSVIKKLILARCIVDHPRLVATEPLLNNVEAHDREKLMELLLSRKKPWTLVAVCRNSIMAQKCDRIIVLDKGEIIFKGTYDELLSQPYFNLLFDDL